MSTAFNVVHILCFLATFYREIFSSKTDLFGQFMRIMEIVCIPLYLACILSGIQHLTTIMIRFQTKDEKNNKFLSGRIGCDCISCERKCLLKDFEKFGGKFQEWLIVEVMVFFFFILTMLIIMCKSRFMKVGTDNTTQFDKAYMAELANLIMKSTDPFIKDAD